MNLIWQIEAEDIQKVQAFVARYQGNKLVEGRIERNIKGNDKPELTPTVVWNEMVVCLLTTRQRSGPGSAVDSFSREQPFPLTRDVCKARTDLEQFVKDTLTGFGGLRRTNKIADYITANLPNFAPGAWEATRQVLAGLPHGATTIDSERQAAHFIAEQYKGFGPKQSRNLLQMLGLTRYEIPLDSRVMKWLDEFGFPLTGTGGALSNIRYYELIMDGIQELCRRCIDIYPCVLDAAIFASFDEKE